MTSQQKTEWLSYWSEQDDPQNFTSGATNYEAYGSELALLFNGTESGRVLEVGCGDGSLIKSLGFDHAERFLGIDPSEPMLQAFNKRHPDLDTTVGDHTFRIDEQFDLIFSAAVVQFMNDDMARTHMENCRSMLAPGGRIVWGSVPWTRMRWAYARRDVTGFPRRSLPLAIAAHAKRRLIKDNMGFWHDTPYFSALAEEHGLDYAFFGSLNYSYRFHSVFDRPPTLSRIS